MSKLLELEKKRVLYLEAALEPTAFDHRNGPPRRGQNGKMYAGHRYTPGKQSRYMREIQIAARIGDPVMFEKDIPLLLWVEYGVRRPKTVKRVYPVVRPDLTNYTKILEDSLNGIWWVDDSQVIAQIATKVYSNTPYVRAQCEPYG